MGKGEKLFVIWSVIAIALVIYFSRILNAAFPLFTLVWLGTALIVVLHKKYAGAVGFIGIPIKEFLKTTIINLAITAVIFGLFEPWSHTYQTLLRLATGNNNPDVTFAWLIRFNGFESWLGMFIFGGFITLFGEEVFFRGLLLQFFKKHMPPFIAIALQALLFILPNILAAIMMTKLQGAIYAVVYSGIAIGIAGGWAANRTNSIWPSLVSASIINLILVLML